MQMPADTERLHFEPLGSEHVDVLIAMNTDPSVMEFLDPEPTTRDELESTIIHYSQTCARKGLGIGFWAIVDKASETTIGWLELSAPLDERPLEAELGYRMLPAWWGKGLATEAAGIALRHAFEHAGLQRVFAHTMFVNRRSRRVMEKIGMRHVRTFFPEWDNPFPGSEQGEVEYAITRETWRDMR